MNQIAKKLGEHAAALQALNHAYSTQTRSLLALATKAEARDQEAADVLLTAIERVGRSQQAREGELILLLAQVDRIKGPRAGLAPWLSTHLDMTDGAARAIAQSARQIGAIPELAEPLASGDYGSATFRALTRTARAVKGTGKETAAILTETLNLVSARSVGEVNKQVRILEETVDPGRAQRLLDKQRSRSFLRVSLRESGMYRIEGLIDPERATGLKATLDQTVSAWLRARQYDKCEAVGEDLVTVEQLQAQALVRFAQVFALADSKQRGARFTPGTIYHAPLDPNRDAGLAETAYGDQLPRTVLAPLGDPAAQLIEHDEQGEPVLLDGQELDQDPSARLASKAQRTALGWRDRTCRHPGCKKPTTWSLHAHHQVPYSRGGPTVMGNLALFCAEHHIDQHRRGR